MGCITSRNHDRARRVLIEAMDDAGTQRPADRRKPADATKPMQQRRNQSAGISARAWMNDDSCWLIDDGDVVIFVNQIERNIFGLDACGKGGRNINDNRRALLHLVRRLHRGAVNEHASFVHKFLDAGAADLGEFQREKTIEAGTRLLGRNNKLDSLRHRVLSWFLLSHARWWAAPQARTSPTLQHALYCPAAVGATADMGAIGAEPRKPRHQRNAPVSISATLVSCMRETLL